VICALVWRTMSQSTVLHFEPEQGFSGIRVFPKCVLYCSTHIIGLDIKLLQIEIYLLTPASEVLLVKVIEAQLEEKFPAFYGTGRFISMFTRALHWNVF